MSRKIQLLPESTANQIAAGEVVQRPASVVKELLENSIDAGATGIQLYIKNGGCTYIQVDDNGIGMNAFDARMSWERHATSKITQASDLYNLNTLGFRGEALASIASVSEIEMKTKVASEDVATRIEISAGKIQVQENAAAKQGTSITVKNLFFNIPARKNFLKSITVETKHIFDEFQRIALSYPNVAFDFYNQGKMVTSLKATDLKSRICELLGVKETELIETNEQTDIVNITGFLGSTKLAKRTRGRQFLFTNGRFIKDAYLNHAITSGYEGLLEEKQYPFYILFLEVDPSKLDVNIHPTKHEVKFEDGRHVYTLIKSVVRKTLGSHFTIPTASQIQNTDFPKHESSPFQSNSPNTRFNPFGEQKPRVRSEWEKLDDLLTAPVPTHTQPAPQELELVKTNYVLDSCFQVNDSFIVAKIDGGLWLINQHRAHKQILFEAFGAQNAVSSQQLLFPRSVELTAAQYAIFLDLKKDIVQLGFDVDEFGKNAVIINGLPSELSKLDGERVLVQVLDDFSVNFQDLKLDKLVSIKLAAAQNAAIRAGYKMSSTEMNRLIDDLMHCNSIAVSETGKTIVVKIDKDSLERFFQ